MYSIFHFFLFPKSIFLRIAAFIYHSYQRDSLLLDKQVEEDESAVFCAATWGGFCVPKRFVPFNFTLLSFCWKNHETPSNFLWKSPVAPSWNFVRNSMLSSKKTFLGNSTWVFNGVVEGFASGFYGLSQFVQLIWLHRSDLFTSQMTTTKKSKSPLHFM